MYMHNTYMKTNLSLKKPIRKSTVLLKYDLHVSESRSLKICKTF